MYPDYEMIDTILDPEQTDPGISLSENGRIARKSGESDGFSWSYVQSKHGVKKEAQK
jgi:hypothetical protein